LLVVSYDRPASSSACLIPISVLTRSPLLALAAAAKKRISFIVYLLRSRHLPKPTNFTHAAADTDHSETRLNECLVSHVRHHPRALSGALICLRLAEHIENREAAARNASVGGLRLAVMAVSSFTLKVLTHVQCDEKIPRCSPCVRHDKDCIYVPSRATPSSSTVSHCSPLRSDASPQIVETHSPGTVFIPSLDAGDVNLPGALFELEDLALLHHWSLVTSVSIVNTPQLDHFWQTVLPQVGFRHQYVMHNVLSLAALHIAYLDPSRRQSSLLKAAEHHVKALDGFREDIARICAANADALFASAVLTSFYAFLTIGKLYDDGSATGDVNGIARTSRVLGTDWIPLARGIQTVLYPIYDHVRVGPLKDLLGVKNWEELDIEANSDSYDGQIIKLRDIWKQGENAEVYNQTLDHLRRCRMWMAQFEVSQTDNGQDWGYNRSWSGPFVWLLGAPQKYFELLQQRQPPALLIFAWFGASLQCLNKHWWMEGCGRSIVDVIDECLGPYWVPWTEWPKHIVRTD
jgi:hypothetical protein